MSSKKFKSGPTDEELLAQFDELGTGDSSTKEAPKTHSSRQSREEADLLAELDNLAQERPKSRPHTPRSVPGSAPTGSASAETGSGRRPSEERSQSQTQTQAQARKSADSTRSFHQARPPVDNATAELGKRAHEGAPEAREQATGGAEGGGGGGG
ncbi:MAG: hypothetical protein LQ340_001054, partial [Diploschistes diacapsis]